MTINLYHQVGHNWNWNKDSFVEDQCGDGLIFSPVHQSRPNIEKLNVPLRKASIFDPQFYLPNSQKQKLHSYSFFPEVLTDGFSTSNFSIRAMECARQCLQFQQSMNFRYLIIPARYFDQMDPEYTERQEAYTVAHFLAAAKEIKTTKPLFLTLPLTSHMLESAKYRTDLLNWVTKFQDISGVYIFAANERDTKQAASADFLSAYLSFLAELRSAGLELLVGYTNAESLLLTMVGEVSITMGAFENTRIFSTDKFVSNDEDRRGPKARIYVPGLLNWIQFEQAKQIKKKLPGVWDRVHSSTSWADQAFSLIVEPTFNQAPLYKHYFQVFSKQIGELKPLAPAKRKAVLEGWITDAITNHAEIRNGGVELEKHGGASHLASWSKVVSSFES